MITRSSLRTGVAFTAAVAALYAGTAALPNAEARSAEAAPKKTTTLTFEVPDCEGCELTLVQARWDDSKKYGVRTWNGPTVKVRDGEATAKIPTSRTWGMSVLVDAPWEGGLPAQTTVAFRYAGQGVGDEVTFAEARRAKKASACWEGTRQDEVTLPLTIREVTVQGHTKKVDGSIAYVNTTESWLQPMRRTFDRGVLASQDVNVCGPRG